MKMVRRSAEMSPRKLSVIVARICAWSLVIFTRGWRCPCAFCRRTCMEVWPVRYRRPDMQQRKCRAIDCPRKESYPRSDLRRHPFCASSRLWRAPSAKTLFRPQLGTGSSGADWSYCCCLGIRHPGQRYPTESSQIRHCQGSARRQVGCRCARLATPVPAYLGDEDLPASLAHWAE